LDFIFGPHARQQFVHRLGHHNSSLLVLEAGDQADVFGRPPHFTPGDPHAVGWPQFGLAQMLGELVLGVHVFLLGLLIGRNVVLGIEGIDGQHAFFLHRLAVIFSV
jgi:hypothetical protein